jgi:hypothetical protein
VAHSRDGVLLLRKLRDMKENEYMISWFHNSAANKLALTSMVWPINMYFPPQG